MATIDMLPRAVLRTGGAIGVPVPIPLLLMGFLFARPRTTWPRGDECTASTFGGSADTLILRAGVLHRFHEQLACDSELDGRNQVTRSGVLQWLGVRDDFRNWLIRAA